MIKRLDIIIVYLDNISIFTKNSRQSHIEAIYSVLDEFQKYFLFTNLKKYQFDQNKVHFLKYIVLSKK